MKKIVLLAGSIVTAFVLAGCNQDNTGEGGTSDQYGTSSGSSSNYDYNAGQSSSTNSYNNTQNSQGAATSPGGQSSGNDAGRTNAYNTGTGVR